MKKGSALLLVLGMLSFMVISAVAFSAFMRYSRLPSSYLRRSSSSRLLVKAALAEAIDIVDAAIADNPHPGVGYKTIRYPRRTGGYKPPETQEETRNHWRCHVFTGTNYLVSAADTVSTLTLEGLAYLPPALINEVRYYSRHSTAAMWRSFGYDSGRFAFCAVDVSDHFDVNKVAADIGRGSAPGNRFSLAYVFEGQDHTSYTVNPSSWDAFMKKYVQIAATKEVLTPWQNASAAAGSASLLPLVSVADLNLAVNRDGAQFKQYFPFVSYVTGASDDYVTSETSAAAEMQRHMAFVTDGYYPSSGGSGDDDSLDLADRNFQPFTEAELDANNVSLNAFVRGGIGTTETGKLLHERLAHFGMVALYDYLDEDQVPVSLALPQTERSPMICGIRQEGLDGKLAIKKTTEPSNDLSDPDFPGADYRGAGKDTATSRRITQTTYYKIDGNKFHAVFDSGKITAVVAYPFRRGNGFDDSGSYALDGHLEFFFTRDAQGFRTGGSGNDILHMANDADFKADAVKDRAVFHVPLSFGGGAGGISPSSFGKKEEESVKEYTAMLKSGGSALSNIPQFFENNDNALLKVVCEYDQTRTKDPMTGNMGAWTTAGDPKKTPTVGVWPIKDGVADESVNTPAILTAGATYTLRAAVWLRIRNTDENKTVDLVPACTLDDVNFLGNNNGDAEIGRMTGSASPLMLFSGGSFALNEEALEKADEVSFGLMPQGVMVSDPRWNWAPEHWYRFDTVSQNTWLQEVKTQLGQDGRDTDIFMASSDANYMQSVYELAFLPRLTDLLGVGASSFCGNMTRVANAGRNEWATTFGDAANSHLMWRTYRPYANAGGSGAVRDDFESLGIVNEGGGMKLNPYSDNENVLVSAFANTPCCWWAASANDETGIPKAERTKDAPSFNKKYAWSELGGNTDAKFAWKDLLNVVSTFKAKMQAQTDVNGWEDAYDELWRLDGNDADSLMGAKLENDTVDLYGVDRKFLYGYWHDCFAVKQQLFLVFVRAEPMMMGGGIIGQTPPQLGARAVALVWRNPYRGSKSYAESGEGGSSTPEYAPHQTRVLFYRQFD